MLPRFTKRNHPTEIQMLSSNYRRVVLALALAATLVSTASAQTGTMGIVGTNDYTLNGMGSTTRSCTLLFPFPSGPAVLNVSTTPGTPVVFMFNLNCPCRACFFPWPAAVGCPLPPLLCGPSNQAFELDATTAGCIFVSASTVADSSGNATITVGLPAFIRFSTQAIALDPCSTAVPPIVFSQAYNVSTT